MNCVASKEKVGKVVLRVGVGKHKTPKKNSCELTHFWPMFPFYTP